MITESTFVGCDSLPEDMRRLLDQPWHFLGEVKPYERPGRPFLTGMCEKCNRDLRKAMYVGSADYINAEPIATVDMDGRMFITDDMIEVIIYFGVCRKCDSVHWARTGPPFRRARAYADALA